MTDRELLVLAAKAAGIELDWTVPQSALPHTVISEGDTRRPHRAWSALHDDGDALRLAVKLELDIMFLNGDTIVLNASNGGGEPNARTRRAIVRAAAEIGRSLP